MSDSDGSDRSGQWVTINPDAVNYHSNPDGATTSGVVEEATTSAHAGEQPLGEQSDSSSEFEVMQPDNLDDLIQQLRTKTQHDESESPLTESGSQDENAMQSSVSSTFSFAMNNSLSASTASVTLRDEQDVRTEMQQVDATDLSANIIQAPIPLPRDGDEVRSYVHQPNVNMNLLLSRIAWAAIMCGIGVGVGHCIGSMREQYLQEVVRESEAIKLLALKAELKTVRAKYRDLKLDYKFYKQELTLRESEGDLWREKSDLFSREAKLSESRTEVLETRVDVLEQENTALADLNFDLVHHLHAIVETHNITSELLDRLHDKLFAALSKEPMTDVQKAKTSPDVPLIRPDPDSNESMSNLLANRIAQLTTSRTRTEQVISDLPSSDVAKAKAPEGRGVAAQQLLQTQLMLSWTPEFDSQRTCAELKKLTRSQQGNSMTLMSQCLLDVYRGSRPTHTTKDHVTEGASSCDFTSREADTRVDTCKTTVSALKQSNGKLRQCRLERSACWQNIEAATAPSCRAATSELRHCHGRLLSQRSKLGSFQVKDTNTSDSKDICQPMVAAIRHANTNLLACRAAKLAAMEERDDIVASKHSCELERDALVTSVTELERETAYYREGRSSDAKDREREFAAHDSACASTKKELDQARSHFSRESIAETTRRLAAEREVVTLKEKLSDNRRQCTLDRGRCVNEHFTEKTKLLAAEHQVIELQAKLTNSVRKLTNERELRAKGNYDERSFRDHHGREVSSLREVVDGAKLSCRKEMRRERDEFETQRAKAEDVFRRRCRAEKLSLEEDRRSCLTAKRDVEIERDYYVNEFAGYSKRNSTADHYEECAKLIGLKLTEFRNLFLDPSNCVWCDVVRETIRHAVDLVQGLMRRVANGPPMPDFAEKLRTSVSLGVSDLFAKLAAGPSLKERVEKTFENVRTKFQDDWKPRAEQMFEEASEKVSGAYGAFRQHYTNDKFDHFETKFKDTWKPRAKKMYEDVSKRVAATYEVLRGHCDSGFEGVHNRYQDAWKPRADQIVLDVTEKVSGTIDQLASYWSMRENRGCERTALKQLRNALKSVKSHSHCRKGHDELKARLRDVKSDCLTPAAANRHRCQLAWFTSRRRSEAICAEFWYDWQLECGRRGDQSDHTRFEGDDATWYWQREKVRQPGSW